GGGPFNTARALARLGVPTQFLGRLSTDVYGGQLRDLLEADGADLSLTSFGPESTTLAIANVGSEGHAAYRFLIDGTSAPNLTPQMLPASLAPNVKGAARRHARPGVRTGGNDHRRPGRARARERPRNGRPKYPSIRCS